MQEVLGVYKEFLPDEKFLETGFSCNKVNKSISFKPKYDVFQRLGQKNTERILITNNEFTWTIQNNILTSKKSFYVSSSSGTVLVNVVMYDVEEGEFALSMELSNSTDEQLRVDERIMNSFSWQAKVTLDVKDSTLNCNIEDDGGQYNDCGFNSEISEEENYEWYKTSSIQASSAPFHLKIQGADMFISKILPNSSYGCKTNSSVIYITSNGARYKISHPITNKLSICKKSN